MPPTATPTYRRPIGYLEAFLMGGLSVLVYLYFFFFVDKGANVTGIASLAVSLAFIVNYPHFMASYYILYKDNASYLFASKRFLWAGVIVPLLLLSTFIAIFVTKNVLWLGYMVAVMFFTVGWHYVKQIFGCLVVSNVFKLYFYSPFERGIILFNLYALWMMAWLPGNVYGASYQYYDIRYTGLNISSYVHTLLSKLGVYVDVVSLGKLITFTSIACVVVSLCYIILFHVVRFIQTKKTPHLAGVLAFITLYLWNIPLFFHPSYIYIIPFLHSLQYLAFVRIYTLNTIDDQISSSAPELERKKKFFINSFVFLITIIGLGALMFEILPKALDKEFGSAVRPLGTVAYLVSFILFINIHHYFIDNVLWKKESPLTNKYLFAKK